MRRLRINYDNLDSSNFDPQSSKVSKMTLLKMSIQNNFAEDEMSITKESPLFEIVIIMLRM